jgi:hypothetical protein
MTRRGGRKFGCRPRPTDIRCPTVLPRRLLSVVVLSAIGLMPLAPPEHVHDTTDAEGHHAALTHRHAESHHGYGVASDHDRATVEDADSVVATVDVVSTAASVSFVPRVPVATVTAALQDSEPSTRWVRSDFIERLIHAPPRGPTSLRAPPVPSLL